MKRLAALLAPQLEMHLTDNNVLYITSLSKGGMYGYFCLSLRANPTLGYQRYQAIEKTIISKFESYSAIDLGYDDSQSFCNYSNVYFDAKTPTELLSKAQFQNYMLSVKKDNLTSVNANHKVLFKVRLTNSISEPYIGQIGELRRLVNLLNTTRNDSDFYFFQEFSLQDVIDSSYNKPVSPNLLDEWLGFGVHRSGNLQATTESGSLASFNFYDENQSNCNIAFSSAAGGGASFLTSAIFTEHLKSGGKVFSICDGYGFNSFKYLSDYHENYLELESYSINPFWEINKKLPRKLYIDLAILLTSTQGELDELALAYISLAVNQAIDSDITNLGIIHIYENLITLNQAELASLLELFINGKYKHLFNGKPSSDVSTQFSAFDLEMLNGVPTVQITSLFALIIHAISVSKDNSWQDKSMIHIDEAWNYFGDDEFSNSTAFKNIAQSIFNIAEELNICLFISTQSTLDFNRNYFAKKFFKSARTEISCYQKPEDVLRSIGLGLITVEQKELRLKSRAFRGKYNTIFIKQDNRYGSFRIHFSDLLSQSISTAPQDIEKKILAIEKNGSIENWMQKVLVQIACT